MFRKRPSAPVGDYEPFNIHATAPLGSRGDSFDGKLHLPNVPSPELKEEYVRRRKAEAEAAAKAIGALEFKPFEPLLHPAATAAWVLLALSATMTGTFKSYALYAACGAVALAVLAVLHLRFGRPFSSGLLSGSVATALGVLLIVWHAIPLESIVSGVANGGWRGDLTAIHRAAERRQQALDGIYDAGKGWRGGPAVANPPYVPKQVRLGTNEALPPDEEWNALRTWMRDAAEIAVCLARRCGEGRVFSNSNPHPETGLEGPDNRYRYIPSIAIHGPCVQDALESYAMDRHANNLWRVAAVEPYARLVQESLRDPYSPRGEYLFGFAVRENRIIVWSSGPDRDVDFQIAKDYDPANPEAVKKFFHTSYDPTNGVVSGGDAMLILLVDSVECPGEELRK